MSLQSYVTSEIKKVCPIIGISFGDLCDKSTWTIQYDDVAIPEQIAAAQAFLESFIWCETTQLLDSKHNRDLRYIDEPIYKAGYRSYTVIHPTASFTDYMDSLENPELQNVDPVYNFYNYGESLALKAAYRQELNRDSNLTFQSFIDTLLID